jgi:cell pole-organizing protein PopZ
MSNSKSQQQEPSMEDILSSIRRIISEDGDQKPEAEDVPEAEAIPETEAAPEETAEAADESDDVFDLTEMVDDSGSVLELGRDDGEGVPEALDGDEEEVFEGVEEDTVASAADEDTEPLMSDGAEDKATEALSRLAQVASKGPVDPSLLRIMNSGLTIEQYVIEMLRPMLREWLDQNLPSMVERLVEREIEKLSRRADPLD